MEMIDGGVFLPSRAISGRRDVVNVRIISLSSVNKPDDLFDFEVSSFLSHVETTE